METVTLIALAVALCLLWRRVARLEDRLRALESPPAEPEVPSARAARPPAAPYAPAPARPEPLAAEHIPPDEPGEAPPRPRRRRPRIGFEELFGRRLPIWAGGITLAVAGVLIVRYSIDAGLLSPAIRVALGAIFGTSLLAAAELALHQRARIADPRVAQALAGAGIATLYATVLIAANLYGLVGDAAAFAGLAGVTALALVLALRFGAPSALLGLAGGLAAPALVGASTPDVPLLATYLALTVGGLCAVSRAQRWAWIGIAALAGGAGWSLVLILAGAIDTGAVLAIGALVLLFGIALPLAAARDDRQAARITPVAAAIAAVQMALLVANGGFTGLNWSLFALLSAALVWLANRDPALARLPAIGLGIVLLLLAAWPRPSAAMFAGVGVMIGAIYAAPALWRLSRRGGANEAWQIAAVSVGGLVVSLLQFLPAGSGRHIGLALLALTLGGLPGAGLAFGRSAAGQRPDDRRAVLATAAALLVAAAALLVLPDWTAPAVFAGGAIGLLLLAGRAQDLRVERCAWGFAGAALLALTAGHTSAGELARLAGEGPAGGVVLAARWLGAAAAAGAFAWRASWRAGRTAAQVILGLAAYGLVAQLAPASLLGTAAALMLLPLALLDAARRPTLAPYAVTMLMIGLAWAVQPLADWADAALRSLHGLPMLARDLPPPSAAMQRLLLPAAISGFALRLTTGALPRRPAILAASVLIVIGTVGTHIAYKQVFQLSDDADLVRLALAERTLWEALLLGAGLVLSRIGWPRAAVFALAAALLHNLVYTVLLHNPLWAAQAVGPLPVLNLLLPAFAVPLVAMSALLRVAPEAPPWLERALETGRIAIVTLFASASLRHAFHGSLLTSPGTSAAEEIGRSVLAVALAIGFLLWGIRRRSRAWRIASLLLMLVAVAKVFLIDAAGLDGLLRIGSFVALGFSLIAIGWLYSRQLAREDPPPQD